jgi:hypothetical protein
MSKTASEIIATAEGNRAAVAAFAPEHAKVIEAFKEQLLLAFVRRLGGKVTIPAKEVDETGNYVLSFSVADGSFNFTLGKKQ